MNIDAIGRITLWIFWTPLALLASVMEFDTLKVSFVQQVLTDEQHAIIYTGTLWLKQPDQALWHYETPIEKSIYVRGSAVTILESELFQATHLRQDTAQNLIELFRQSKSIGPNLKEARINNVLVKIAHDEQFITQLSYRDEFDHTITIELTDPEKDLWLESRFFEPIIPPGYDEFKIE